MLKITLANNEIVTSDKCSWNKLSWMPIQSLEFFIKNTPIIYMSGFDSYIQLKEHAFCFGKSKDQYINTIYLLGKHKTYIYQFALNFKKAFCMQRTGKWNNDEFRPMIWNPTLQNFEWGKARLTNHNEWHIGVIGNAIVKRN